MSTAAHEPFVQCGSDRPHDEHDWPNVYKGGVHRCIGRADYSAEVEYPPGTPEHAQYARELRVELDKFASGEHPYPYGPQGTVPTIEVMAQRVAEALATPQPELSDDQRAKAEHMRTEVGGAVQDLVATHRAIADMTGDVHAANGAVLLTLQVTEAGPDSVLAMLVTAVGMLSAGDL